MIGMLDQRCIIYAGFHILHAVNRTLVCLPSCCGLFRPRWSIMLKTRPCPILNWSKCRKWAYRVACYGPKGAFSFAERCYADCLEKRTACDDSSPSPPHRFGLCSSAVCRWTSNPVSFTCCSDHLRWVTHRTPDTENPNHAQRRATVRVEYSKVKGPTTSQGSATRRRL